MQKGGKRKKSAWMQHVAKTMAEMPNVALRDVLKAASKTYKKGSSVTGAVSAKPRRKRRRKTRQKTRRKKRRKKRRKTRRKTRRRRRR